MAQKLETYWNGGRHLKHVQIMLLLREVFTSCFNNMFFFMMQLPPSLNNIVIIKKKISFVSLTFLSLGNIKPQKSCYDIMNELLIDICLTTVSIYIFATESRRCTITIRF